MPYKYPEDKRNYQRIYMRKRRGSRVVRPSVRPGMAGLLRQSNVDRAKGRYEPRFFLPKEIPLDADGNEMPNYF